MMPRPYRAAKRGAAWVTVDANGKKVSTSGHFKSKARASRQAAALNAKKVH
jgi:hypothetical protein